MSLPQVLERMRSDPELAANFTAWRELPRTPPSLAPFPEALDPRLAEVLKKQTVFEHKDVAGTMVGFRLPKYLGGANVAGCHLHFLTADRSAGGHVLEFRIKNARIRLDLTDRFHLVLPDTGAFYQAELDPAGKTDARKAAE